VTRVFQREPLTLLEPYSATAEKQEDLSVTFKPDFYNEEILAICLDYLELLASKQAEQPAT